MQNSQNSIMRHDDVESVQNMFLGGFSNLKPRDITCDSAPLSNDDGRNCF